jgi:hypothetical protein
VVHCYGIASEPNLFATIIPIAAELEATDWLIACHVQETILSNSSNPIQTARQHAMTFMGHHQGLKQSSMKKVGDHFINQWLECHGEALEERFFIPSTTSCSIISYGIQMHHMISMVVLKIWSKVIPQFI